MRALALTLALLVCAAGLLALLRAAEAPAASSPAATPAPLGGGRGAGSELDAGLPPASPATGGERQAAPAGGAARGGASRPADPEPPAWTSAPQAFWGRVRSPERPLAGAELELVGAAGEGEILARARAGPGGEFQLQLEAPVTGALLRATHPGHAVFEQGPLSLAAGQKRSLGTLTLAPAGPFTGRVVAGDGRPLPGAEVRLGVGGSARTTNHATVSALTDERGRFVLERAPQGPVRLTVLCAGYEPRILASLRAPEDSGVEVRLAPEGRR